MQKQRFQVRQYLSESFSNGTSGQDALLPLFPQDNAIGPSQTQSAPGETSNYGNGITHPPPQVYGHSHPLYTSGPSPSPNSDAPVMSPALSSGATSTSDQVSYG